MALAGHGGSAWGTVVVLLSGAMRRFKVVCIVSVLPWAWVFVGVGKAAVCVVTQCGNPK